METSETPCGIPPEEVQKLQINETKIISSVCSKCQKDPSIILFRKDSTCRKCFDALLLKKFKQALNVGRKNKGTSEHVLLAFSGGASSRALLHLMSTSINERHSKDTFFTVSVIHIDESCISNEDDKQKNEKVESIVKKYGFKLIMIRLEDIFSIEQLLLPRDSEVPNKFPEVQSDQHMDNAQKLKTLLSSATTNSSKEDIVNQLRFALLAHAAKEGGFEKVLVGSSANRMAINLIAFTCKGRGFALPDELSALGTKYEGISLLRPMRDVLAKEIAVYNRFNELEYLTIPNMYTKAGSKFSIDFLSEAFIENLQAEYSHTVHTLLRSGSKLSMPYPTNSPLLEYKCSLCSSYMSPTEIERVMQRKESCTTTNKEGCDDCDCKEGKEEESSCSTQKQPAIDLKSLVCYGCRRVLNESNEQLLPPFVHNGAKKQFISKKLREEIKDFLLEDDE